MSRVASTLCVLVGSILASGCSVPIVRNIPMLSPEDPHFEIEHLHSVRSPQFRRSIGYLLGPQIETGNRVETLLNGDEIFPAMLEAIAGARESINLETFIYWEGDVGERFTQALSARAQAGIAVNVIIDWAGSGQIDGKFLDGMKDAGVHISLYHEVPWYNPLRWRDIAQVENRTHRKILVVDGKIGFTGGVGIADLWSGNAESPEHWRDTHFRVTGPVVAQLQSAFIDNWLESGGQVLHGDRYFPSLPPTGSHRAQAFKGSPREATENIELMYRLAIAAAERSIKLSSAYFVPNPGTIAALIEAARRGVKVQIIVPGEHLDSQLVKAASPGLWGELLEAGIEIHRYQPTMFHCKVLVIDDYFSSLGSTNFDNRSFQLNDEVNLNLFDARFSAEQARIFDRDLERSKRYTHEDWKNRPWYQKAVNWAVRPFRREL